jgi:hypothetical protein
MKKAKIMLSAITVVGALGAAFALNAHRYIGNFVYTGATGTLLTGCQRLVVDAAIALAGRPNVYASTSSLVSGCPFTATVQVLGD